MGDRKIAANHKAIGELSQAHIIGPKGAIRGDSFKWAEDYKLEGE